MSRRPRLAVALDVPTADEALAAAVSLRGHADIVKVGLELFVAAGPALVQQLVDDGWAVFLDLKLHDIPATVAGAVRSADRLGVELLTLHTSGGRSMMEAAVAARGAGRMPQLLGVTVLTSLDRAQIEEVGFGGGAAENVERLARLAHAAGCDGVVSSPHEIASIKQACGEEFAVVSPGIRSANAPTDDQARVATAADAVLAGADVLVVGRPIMKAPDPAAAAARFLAEIEESHARRE